MKRNMLLTFTDETEWATVLEAMRRRPYNGNDKEACARALAAICREFLDAPPAAKNGEPKP